MCKKVFSFIRFDFFWPFMQCTPWTGYSRIPFCREFSGAEREWSPSETVYWIRWTLGQVQDGTTYPVSSSNLNVFCSEIWFLLFQNFCFPVHPTFLSIYIDPLWLSEMKVYYEMWSILSNHANCCTCIDFSWTMLVCANWGSSPLSDTWSPSPKPVSHSAFVVFSLSAFHILGGWRLWVMQVLSWRVNHSVWVEVESTSYKFLKVLMPRYQLTPCQMQETFLK